MENFSELSEQISWIRKSLHLLDSLNIGYLLTDLNHTVLEVNETLLKMIKGSREELIGQEFDTINLRWGWRIFITEFSSGVSTPIGWYQKVAALVSGKMLIPLSLVALSLLVGLWILKRF